MIKASLVSYSDLPLEWEAFLRLERFNIFLKGVEDIYINSDKANTNQPVEKDPSSKSVSISSSGKIKKD